MNDDKADSSRRTAKVREPSKRKYQAPELQIFGSVGQLTQGGTGKDSEAKGGSDMGKG